MQPDNTGFARTRVTEPVGKFRERWTARLVVIAGALSTAAVAEPTQKFPVRQAGLWEIQSTVSKSNGMAPIRQCVGNGSDTANVHLDRATGKRGFCQLGPFEREKGEWVAKSVCRHHRNNVITRKVATGNFTSHYQIETLVRSGSGKRSRVLMQDTLTARYLGPCRKNQRSGDLVAPGMGTLNMSDGAFKAEK